MKKLIVLFVNGKPKGIVTEASFKSMRTHWWHTKESIEVPIEDWEKDKVRIDTIHNYL